MKRLFSIVGILIGVIILTLVIGSIVLLNTTKGEYPVLATVSSNAELPSIDVLGIKLHAETFGDSLNPALIVLHGGPGGDYRSLMSLKALADEYYVIFYDQRGAGLSERVPAEQLAINDYLHELDAVVEKYNHGDAVYIVGHSWGAMLLSAYLGYAPEKVAKAVLAEPGFLTIAEFQDWMDFQKQFYASFNFLWFAIRTGFEAQHINSPDSSASQDYLYAKLVSYFTNHPKNPYHCPGEAFDGPIYRFGAIASEAAQQATPEDIAILNTGADKFYKPVLFLAGKCDTWIGPELQAKHAALYQNAKLAVIDNSGHNMFWDQPEQTIRVVRAFLGNSPATAVSAQ